MSGSGPGRREVAYRLFAAEFDDAELSYSESDEERAPNYVVTPTGARVNRLFAVGVLTEVEDVNPEMVRGRVVDPTGAFVTYAGQYQPDALAFLERAEPPTFLALSGKARTYEPDDGDQIYTSVRPEVVSEVDSETRDRWVVRTAERTIERIGIAASAIESELSGDRLQASLSEAGVDDRLAEGVSLALEYYGTTPAYLKALRNLAIDAVRVVAGERDEVGHLKLDPGEGNGDVGTLTTLDLSAPTDTPTGVKSEAKTGIDDDDVAMASGETPIEDEPTVTTTSDIGGASETKTDHQSMDTETEEMATEPGVESEEETVPGSEGTNAESSASEDVGSVEEELENFDPGEFELDEEKRREVEEEFGTEFSTAGEVESPESETEDSDGVDGSEVNESDESDAKKVEKGTGAESEPRTEPKPDTSAPAPSAEPASGEDAVDLTDAVMDTMERLDEGEGTDRDALVSTVVDKRGVAPEDVEEAIQDALMGGRCYEPTDGTLKPI